MPVETVPQGAVSELVPTFPISTEEALARLAIDDPIEARFERRPNIGVTLVYEFNRGDVEAFIREAGCVCESGVNGQREDFGIHLLFDHWTKGPGVFFFKTRPERRISEEEILRKEAALNEG